MIFSLAWSWPRPADASGRRLGSMFFSLPRGKLWPSSGYPGAGPGPVRTTHRGLGSMILVLSSGWPSLPSPPSPGLLGSLLERSLVLKWSTGPRYPGGSDQSVKHDLFLGPISFPSPCMTPFLGHHYFSASQKQDFRVTIISPRPRSRISGWHYFSRVWAALFFHFSPVNIQNTISKVGNSRVRDTEK